MAHVQTYIFAVRYAFLLASVLQYASIRFFRRWSSASLRWHPRASRDLVRSHFASETRHIGFSRALRPSTAQTRAEAVTAATHAARRRRRTRTTRRRTRTTADNIAADDAAATQINTPITPRRPLGRFLRFSLRLIVRRLPNRIPPSRARHAAAAVDRRAGGQPGFVCLVYGPRRGVQTFDLRRH